MKRLIYFVLLLLGGAPAWLALAADLPADASRYRLYSRDLLQISVFGEPTMEKMERRVDGNGEITLPLLGAVMVKGLTAAQAEARIRQIYVEKEIFVEPQVSVSVESYFPREVSVIGQVRLPGVIAFPIESEGLSIVEVISKAGGFTRISKAESVQVTRKTPTGQEQTFTINVESMLKGQGTQASFDIVPGDIVYVPERVF